MLKREGIDKDSKESRVVNKLIKKSYLSNFSDLTVSIAMTNSVNITEDIKYFISLSLIEVDDRWESDNNSAVFKFTETGLLVKEYLAEN